MKAIGCLMLAVALMIYSALINGWALSKLWGWFMVPVFGLPALTIPAAIGIAIVIGYLAHQADLARKTETEDFLTLMVKGFFHATFKPLFALLTGWIVTAWM